MKMLVYLYNTKCHLQTLIVKHQNLYNFTNCLITPTPIIRTTSYTTQSIIPTNVDSSEFKISFLKNNCGLSGKPLIYACKCLNFDPSDQRPRLVLEQFRTFGIPMSSITKIIASYPRILQSNPEKVIKPKLDFLLSISQSQQDVVAIVTKTPRLLTRSLTNYLIPSLNMFNSVTGCDRNSVSVFKYNPYIMNCDIKKSFMLNTQILLALGVPHSQIRKLLRNYGKVLGTEHDKFSNFASKLTDLGFDPKSSYFLHALRTLTCVKDATWESRCVLFRSFGFSDHEILSMFKKLPQIMYYNEKTIIEKTEFFLNKLQWTPSRLTSYPSVLAYSLEKRTIPRCSVLQVLFSENSTSESYMLSTILVMAEKKFVEDFVNAHKGDVPEVMEAYNGKLRFEEYTFKQKGQLRLKT